MPSTKEQRGGLESGAPEFPGVHRKGLKGTGSPGVPPLCESTQSHAPWAGVPEALQNNPPAAIPSSHLHPF